MASSGESKFVSDWVKRERPPLRPCYEQGCTGHVYLCGGRFAGDCDWAIYQCDMCGAGFEQAGHMVYPIPRVVPAQAPR